MGRVSTGIDDLASDLATQRPLIGHGSPIHARLLSLLESELPAYTEPLAEAWRDRSFSARYERPLLLLASLRWQALTVGESDPLWPGIGSPTPDIHALDVDRLRAALDPGREALWRSLRERFVQTNESGRAVTWLWPATLFPSGSTFELFDLGASGGLNLVADGLPRPWVDTNGDPMPTVPQGAVRGRRGFDANPVDVTEPDEARWLEACIWPEQTARLERFTLALKAMRRTPVRIEHAQAQDMPNMLAPAHPDTRPIAYQSVLRDYLPSEAHGAMVEGMHAFLRRQSPGRALWMELELEGRDHPPDRSAGLTAHVVDGGGRVVSLLIARCHPHPQVVHVDAQAVQRLSALLG